MDSKEITPRLVSISQAEVYTGMSRATLYRDQKAGDLKFVKMGSATRIEMVELDRYIDAKARPAAA